MKRKKRKEKSLLKQKRCAEIKKKKRRRFEMTTKETEANEETKLILSVIDYRIMTIRGYCVDNKKRG